ncbi:MAG TPA: S8 family peptidase [Cyclobacteriaceae bacterium]|nr:S8 family peptidase [Cyclobacteriaceae bacterium]
MNKNLLRFLVIALIFFYPIHLRAAMQSDDSLKQVNWIHYDPVDDSLAGISLNKAYQLLQGRPSKTIIVAIIDSGVDIKHDDLNGNIWVNEDEVPGNDIDDDRNGYIDDVHGWNFIGGQEEDVIYDTYELTREYVRLSKKYGEKNEGKGDEFEYWGKIKADYSEAATKAMNGYDYYNQLMHNIPRYFNLVKSYLDADSLTYQAVSSVTSEDSLVNEALSMVAKLLTFYGDNPSVDAVIKGMSKGKDYYEYQVKYGYNQEFDPRSVVKDNYADPRERIYGNNRSHNYSGDMGSHGTHVSGIIAANRYNDLGTAGIADNVRIMPIRTVPSGDERDKDVANSIYYAVDNGAKVINMSFGKDYSPYREVVEKAIRYAASKGVLIVHAAGNDAKNVDENDNFPTKRFIRGSKTADNMIEVGASSMNLGEKLTASFSNYGKNRVDIFAPGVKVWSSMPQQEYGASSGTSMASPVVAGVAALLMEYFPELSAQKIREIILSSAWRFEGEVLKPGTNDLVKLNDLCASGGIINAYEAVKIAMNTVSVGSR